MSKNSIDAIKQELQDRVTGVDEWSYLDNFCKVQLFFYVHNIFLRFIRNSIWSRLRFLLFCLWKLKIAIQQSEFGFPSGRQGGKATRQRKHTTPQHPQAISRRHFSQRCRSRGSKPVVCRKRPRRAQSSTSSTPRTPGRRRSRNRNFGSYRRKTINKIPKQQFLFHQPIHQLIKLTKFSKFKFKSFLFQVLNRKPISGIDDHHVQLDIILTHIHSQIIPTHNTIIFFNHARQF